MPAVAVSIAARTDQGSTVCKTSGPRTELARNRACGPWIRVASCWPESCAAVAMALAVDRWCLPRPVRPKTDRTVAQARLRVGITCTASQRVRITAGTSTRSGEGQQRHGDIPGKVPQHLERNHGTAVPQHGVPVGHAFCDVQKLHCKSLREYRKVPPVRRRQLRVYTVLKEAGD